jgi:thiol-disulfide isomerase/thioredoxin
MKVKAIPFIAVILFTFTKAFAQEIQTSLPRHSLQQMFIGKQFMADDNKISIESTDQLDSKFLEIEKAWRKYVNDSLALKSTAGIPKAVLHNLDAYTYMLALYNLTGKSDHSQSLEHHLLKKYMLPSLQKDVKALNKDIRIQSHKVIWMGSLSNTLSQGSLYGDDKEIIDQLFSLTNDLKELLNRTQQAADEETAKYSRRLLGELKDYEYEIKAKYFFANKQEDKAMGSFITGVSTNQFLPSRIAPFSKKLIAHYTGKDEGDKAFAILNTMMFSTSTDQISRDSLKVWYDAVDSKRGAALYMRAHKKMGGNLLTNSKVVLKSHPKGWKFLANGLEEEKLQKAKYILVDFWYTGCKPCIEEVPALNEFHEKLKSRDDIVFVSINTDHFSGKKDANFTNGTIKKHSIRFPVIFDDEATSISKELNITGYPAKMIISKEGRLLEKVDGSAITLSTFMELLSSTN